MRKTLLATTAAAALLGFSALATAQNATNGSEPGKGMSSPGAQQEQKASPSGGAMKSGRQSSESKAPSQPNQSAQGAHERKEGAKGGNKQESVQGNTKQGASANQRMGETQDRDQNKAKPQRGAREERGMKGRNAEEEHTTTERGARSESNTNVSAGEHGGSRVSRATSVKLSQDQRTRIDQIIGKGRGHRVSTNEHFTVSVGARVPRNVHIEALPEDIVRIVPEYEGFDYVLLGDEILIIDPDTLEIVAVISA